MILSPATPLPPQKKNPCEANLPGIPYGYQQVWVQIVSGLMWVKTVCKGYQPTTLAGKELKCDLCNPTLSLSIPFYMVCVMLNESCGKQGNRTFINGMLNIE